MIHFDSLQSNGGRRIIAEQKAMKLQPPAAGIQTAVIILWIISDALLRPGRIVKSRPASADLNRWK